MPDRVEKVARDLDDAIDNALIAWGMGWDMDGVMACLKEAKDRAALEAAEAGAVAWGVYRMAVEPQEDGTWLATCPDLPGCIATADTPDAALGRLRDVQASWLAICRERVIKAPEPASPPSEASREGLETMLMAALPEHKASLHIAHNAHRSSYATVEEYLAFLSDHEDEWATPGQREKAIATNELWELQWYPETPVGSCKIYAADLCSLLATAIRARGET